MSGGSPRLQAELRSRNLRRTSTATFTNAFTGVQTVLPIEAEGSNQVTVDVTATNRRMLELTLPPQQSLFDLLDAPGSEIGITQTFRYIDNATETVPLGKYKVTETSMGYDIDGNITLNCPDRYWHITSNGFGANRSSIGANPAWAEIQRLVEGAWPNAAYPFPGWAQLDTSATTKVGTLIWDDGDRSNAIQQLLALNSLDLFFDANGLANLRPIPTLINSTPAVWTVMPGDFGTLKDATRSRDISVIHNVIVVQTNAADIQLPILEVPNTRDPAADPLSSLGPLGRVTLQLPGAFYSSAQMKAAGLVQLNKELTVQRQLDVTSVSNPCLDGYDVVSVILPKGDGTSVQPAEHHIIDSVVIPLVSGGDQGITLRGTRTSSNDTVAA